MTPLFQLPLMLLPPKAIILDDDIELIKDLTDCMPDEIDIIGVSSFDAMEQKINESYINFLSHLSKYFEKLKSGLFNATLAKNYLDYFRLIRPFSVALIDLNLGINHNLEGFEFS